MVRNDRQRYGTVTVTKRYGNGNATVRQRYRHGNAEKTKLSLYIRMINELKTASLILKNEFRPTWILLDFETSAIAAFKFCFPSAVLWGCWFHYGQCLWRKWTELGLKIDYGNASFKKIFKKCVALALLPPGRVTEAFVDFILEEASNLDDAKLTQFLEYMTTTWVDDGLYQIELWNQ